MHKQSSSSGSLALAFPSDFLWHHLHLFLMPKTEGEDPNDKNGQGANASFVRGNQVKWGTQLPNPKRTDVPLSLSPFPMRCGDVVVSVVAINKVFTT